jgi:hypothetical protein
LIERKTARAHPEAFPIFEVYLPRAHQAGFEVDHNIVRAMRTKMVAKEAGPTQLTLIRWKPRVPANSGGQPFSSAKEFYDEG